MTLPQSTVTLSVEDTESIGAELAAQMLSDSSLPRFIALYGDLGVGKTAFTRGFVSVIAPNARVKSPTFAIVNQYKGTHCSVFHFDMYRIESEDELYSIGFFDYIDSGICICEWSENIAEQLPTPHIRAEITKNELTNVNSRLISLSIIQ